MANKIILWKGPKRMQNLKHLQSGSTFSKTICLQDPRLWNFTCWVSENRLHIKETVQWHSDSAQSSNGTDFLKAKMLGFGSPWLWLRYRWLSALSPIVPLKTRIPCHHHRWCFRLNVGSDLYCWLRQGDVMDTVKERCDVIFGEKVESRVYSLWLTTARMS